MTLPKVETFEEDIRSEIKQKESVVTDLVAASGNTDAIQRKSTALYFILALIILIVAGVIAFLVYFFFVRPNITNPIVTGQNTTTPQEIQKSSLPITTVLPRSGATLGPYITHIEKKDASYSITINDYASVLGFILGNEEVFGDDLTKLYPSSGTSTENVISFKDVTLSNQDMRVATGETFTFAYGFVGTTTLLIAENTDALLSARNAILNK